jgi:tetratricopeptide (TPR) repeat protein
MKILFTGICFWLFAGTAAYAQDARVLFDEGNKLYLQQNYPEAIKSYEAVLKGGFESGELYFNLGNAYFKSGRLGDAILAYERAHKLMPNDDDVLFNLQYANLRIVDKIEPVPQLFIYRWADNLLTLFPRTVQVWLIYSSFLATLGLFGYLLFARTFGARRLALFFGLLAGAWFVISAVFYGINSYRASTTVYAVVMSDVANIKSAPDKKGGDAFVLHTGVKVQVLDEVNGWKKIRLADGKIGWIQEQECETI